MDFYKSLIEATPGIEEKLKQASIIDTPKEYIKKTLMTALMMSASITLVATIFTKNALSLLGMLVLAPVLYLYFIKYVDVKIEQIKKKIDEEIVFAGRFLIIELESGVPMYKAFANIEKNYEIVGKYFGDILNKTYLGTNIEDAINDTLTSSPSANLRRILWQVLDTLKTGADIAPALNTVIDQIVKEQKIAVTEYGKKLNPMAMFYMMVSVIIPTLGTTMLVILAMFLSIKINLITLLGMAGFVSFMQFMFLLMIKQSRPPISME